MVPSLEFDERKLRHVYAGSLLEQFARDHDAPAILRELAQNEFDGGGSTLRLEFNSEVLTVKGNGRGIDRMGWRRLSLTLGTGVTQSGGSVDEKKNGIGSKNFGLRSLFRWGNRIYVRSNGYATLLDLKYGVLPEPVRDEGERQRPGVVLEVPYRQEATRKLPAFGLVEESAALTEIERTAAGALLKLLTPSGQGLKNVHVSSGRCETSIDWSQSVRLQSGSTANRQILKRTATLKVAAENSQRETRIEELEFRRTVEIPERFLNRPFPAYFKAGRQKLWLSVSVACRKGRPLTSEPGRFYYPILIEKGWTGCALSVSAPFEMDGDRSKIQSSTSEPWNDWLMREASRFTVDLLRTEFLQRFGKFAWSLLVKRQEASDEGFYNSIVAALQEEEVWPTGARKKPQFRAASKCAIATEPLFQEFLSEDQYVWEELGSDNEIRSLANNAGVTPFGLDQVLAFRTAGEDDDPKWFKGEAGTRWYDENFPSCWGNLNLQISFAKVLERCWKEMGEEKRRALMEAPTCLAADMSLASFGDLSSVDPDIAQSLGFPKGKLIHPALRKFPKSIARCKKFDFRSWVKGVAERASKNEASIEEREALYTQLLQGAISKRDDLRKIRSAPVIKDDKGAWVSAAEVVSRKASGARELEAVLRFPAAALVRQTRVTRHLRIREKLTAKDLLKLFEIVEDQPELSPHAVQMLRRFEKSWMPRIYDKVSRIPFIESDGGLRAPNELYATTKRNVTCLGDRVSYASSLSERMQQHLGCITAPKSTDLVASLLYYREVGEIPSALIYTTLAEAIVRERRDAQSIIGQPIFWSGSEYLSGTSILLSPRQQSLFESIYHPGPPDKELRRAYTDIGIATSPTIEHWRSLLIQVSEKLAKASKKPSRDVRICLHVIYRHLRAAHVELPSNLKCLLAENGDMYSLDDARSLKILLSDDTALAESIRETNVVGLSDYGDGDSFEFFECAGVKRLSAVARHVDTSPGRPLQQEIEPRLRDWIKSSIFGSALKSLVRGLNLTYKGKLDPLVNATCARTADFIPVDQILATFRLGQIRLQVAQSYLVKQNSVYIAAGLGKLHFHGSISQAIATQICGGQSEALALHLQVLLSSRSRSDVKEYLAGKNILWLQVAGTDQDSLFEVPEVNLGDLLADSLKPPTNDPNPIRPSPPTDPIIQRPKKALPSLETVELLSQQPTDQVLKRQESTKRLQADIWASGSQRLPDTDYDRELGRRGEELVFRDELAKVRRLGLSEDLVKWVSSSDPLAPWDIVSIDAEKREVWIEVKSSTSQDGRFQWSAAEFKASVAKGERYILARVYEVASSRPTRKDFPNPMQLLQEGKLVLEVGSLVAEVEGL